MQVEPLSKKTNKTKGEHEDRSAGGILRAERLRKGLTLTEVAEKLHITRHYVTLIESNNYEQLPAAIFAEGYVKNYAELLDLDPNKIIDLYKEAISNAIDGKDDLSSDQKNKINRWILLLMISFFGFIIILWSYNYFFKDESSDVNSEEVLQSNLRIFGESFTSDIEIVVENGEIQRVDSLMEVSLRSELEGQASMNDIQNDGLTPLEEGYSSIRPETSLQLINSPYSASSIQSIQTITESDFDTGPMNATIRVDTGGSDLLSISFTGQSWIEVHDSFETRIYRDIRLTGDVLEIIGNAPFNIFFGDAPFIKLLFNGNEINVAKEIRIDNSAHIVVGI